MAAKKKPIAIAAIFWLTSLFFIFPQATLTADSGGMCVCEITVPGYADELGGAITAAECQKDISTAEACKKPGCHFFTGAVCGVNESYLSSQKKMLIKTTVPCRTDNACNPARAVGGEGLCRNVDQKVCWMNDAAYNKWRENENPDKAAFSAIAADLGIKKPLLEFHIPGLSFTDVQNTLDSEGYIHLPYIGELVAAIYKFGLAVGSIMAAVMIIMSGVRIILSAGGEGKVEGYKRIGQIVVGLVIMWGSYAILYTINPDLVNFKALKILYIEKKDFDGSEAGSEKPSGIAGNCGGAVAGRTQTLADDLGLSGDVFPYARYSVKFGDTCKKPVAIKGIALHYTVTGSSASPRGIVKDWSGSQSRGSICQIIVDLAGQAHQVTEKLEEHVICQGGSSGFNLNDGGIGIEIMGMNESELLANGAQKRAVIELVKKLSAKYGIEKTNKVDSLLSGGNGIFTHHQITRCEGAPNQKDDPGETYAKQIIEGAGGAYSDWQADARCKK